MLSSSYNMPPGCYVHMIPGWDDPDETWMMQHHCSECGAWLKLNPDYSRDFVTVEHCDGKVREYKDVYDERICAIIGDEYLGQEHTVGFALPCQEELYGDNPGDHAPHFFNPPYADMYAINVYICGRCNHHNEVSE